VLPSGSVLRSWKSRVDRVTSSGCRRTLRAVETTTRVALPALGAALFAIPAPAVAGPIDRIDVLREATETVHAAKPRPRGDRRDGENVETSGQISSRLFSIEPDGSGTAPFAEPLTIERRVEDAVSPTGDLVTRTRDVIGRPSALDAKAPDGTGLRWIADSFTHRPSVSPDRGRVAVLTEVPDRQLIADVAIVDVRSEDGVTPTQAFDVAGEDFGVFNELSWTSNERDMVLPYGAADETGAVEVRALSVATDSVSGAAFRRDGRTLASASADKTTPLWDVRTHKQLGAPLTGHAATSGEPAAAARTRSEISGRRAASARRKGPDLIVSRVSRAPAALNVGQAFWLKDVARNAGTRRAKASTTRYYLAPNGQRNMRHDRRRDQGRRCRMPRPATARRAATKRSRLARSTTTPVGRFA
jgi:WD40 repeat protein